MIAAEIAVEKASDRSEPLREPIPDVTALIKTFERPYACSRLLESLRRRFPLLEVVVVDDSRRPRHWRGARTVVLPYDVGASVGRNEGLKHIETEFFLLLDDDNIVYRGTHLRRAVDFMRNHPRVDIYAGQVLLLPFFERSVTSFHRDCFGGPLASAGGLPVYDRPDQFFLARTRAIAAIGWEPRLKTWEHTEFFWRARGRLTAVLDDHFSVLHAKTPFDSSYMKKRTDISTYTHLLRELMK